jgi:hypothetical protein
MRWLKRKWLRLSNDKLGDLPDSLRQDKVLSAVEYK